MSAAIGVVPPPASTAGAPVAGMLRDLGYRPSDPREEDCIASLVAGACGDGLSGGDGLADCAALSAIMPVLLLSGRPPTDFGFRLAAARAGASAIMPAPPDPVDLAGWLGEVDGRTLSPARVLIVDDDPFVAETCALTLQMAGFDARAECDPARTLDAIGEMRPDLLLLDMQMPHASGMEVASVIRQDRAAAALPIVFLSAERDAERRLGARRVGGDDFIDKGVDAATLIEIVRMRTARARTLADIAARDGLTGLLNHAAFRERLERAAGERSPDERSVGMIDIDRFKAVNDRHGHPGGDEVLRTLARTLRGGLRGTDTVARYGGEEFAVLIDAPAAEAARALDRLRARFAALPVVAGEATVRCTFSGGVAPLVANGGTKPDERARLALKAADAALYRAKNEGRDRIVADAKEDAPCSN